MSPFTACIVQTTSLPYDKQGNLDRALRAMRPLDQMDPEGFYLLDFAEDCSDGELSWTYYPPHTYQIALWFPEEDALAVSAVYHRYAFDSYYRLDLSGLELTPGGIVELEAARLQRDYPYGASLLALAGRVALTLGAEPHKARNSIIPSS